MISHAYITEKENISNVLAVLLSVAREMHKFYS
jgi:hypothetical protein